MARASLLSGRSSWAEAERLAGLGKPEEIRGEAPEVWGSLLNRARSTVQGRVALCGLRIEVGAGQERMRSTRDYKSGLGRMVDASITQKMFFVTVNGYIS